MLSKKCLGWVLCGVALSCPAQDLRMTGPITGLVFDGPSRSLRLIVGMPGAARLDTTLVSELDWASVAPNGRMALMVRQGETRLFSRDRMETEPDGAIVAGMIESPRMSAWASDSSSVVLFSPTTQSLQWVRFSAQAASVDAATTLPGVDGTVTALAADHSSGLALVAVEGKGIYRVSAADGASLLCPVSDASAMALEPGGSTLWVADRSNAQLLQVTLDRPESAPAVLLADPDHLADVSVIGLSADRKNLYLGDRSTKRLYLLERSTSALSQGLALEATASQLMPVGRPTVLLLGQRENLDEPLYILDEGAGLSIYFVPVMAGR